MFKDGMGRIWQKPKTHTEYTLDPVGVAFVDNATHVVVRVIGKAWGTANLHGREIYASKGRLIDVETTKTLATFTRARKFNLQGTLTL